VVGLLAKNGSPKWGVAEARSRRLESFPVGLRKLLVHFIAESEIQSQIGFHRSRPEYKSQNVWRRLRGVSELADPPLELAGLVLQKPAQARG